MKISFQNPEEFMKDYEAYKKGCSYKFITPDGVEYLHESVYNNKLQYTSFFPLRKVGIVDLKHKFQKVCKID